MSLFPARFPLWLLSWLAAVWVALLSACGEPEAFKGTVLTSGDSAPGFELINQFGGQVNSNDYLGSPVLLTFLYTSCPDVCPITAGQLRETLDLLGEEADRVRVAVISVDPERDTVEAAREFSERWDMADAWDFLVGGRDVLEPLWRAYYIDPAIEDHASSAGSSHPSPQGGATGSLQQSFSERYLVVHSNPVYLMDDEGVMRVVFTSPLDPDEIAHDVRLLLD